MSGQPAEVKKQTEKINDIDTTHSLDFEVAEWRPNESRYAQLSGHDFDMGYMKFRVGTVEGLWQATTNAYIILAVVNSEPGNGHFEDLLEWFYHSCTRDCKNLVFQELMNDRFARHLREKRGFNGLMSDTLVKFESDIRSELANS